MKKNYFLFFFLLLFYSLAKGEELVFHQELIWNEVVSVKQDDNTEIQFLSFDGSGTDVETKLPFFSSRFYLGKSSKNIKVKLSNPVYEAFPYSEIQKINNLDKVSFEITIESYASISRKSYYGNISFIPIRKSSVSGLYEKLLSFDLIVDLSPALSKGEGEKTKMKTAKTYSLSSVLASGNWYKVAISKDGIYKLGYDDLQQLGMDVASINTNDIRLYGNGGGMLPYANSDYRYDDLQENAIYVNDGNDGKMDASDYILFYGQSPHQWNYNSSDKHFYHTQNLFSDSSYYFITADLGSGKRIATASSEGLGTLAVNTYDEYAYHEMEQINMLNSGRFWYGEVFDQQTQYTINDFNFSNIDTTSSAWVRISVVGAATVKSSFSLDIAGIIDTSISISAITGEYYKDHASQTTNSYSFTPTSESIPITLTYNKSTSTASGWLDYILMNIRRNLVYENEALKFRDAKNVMVNQICDYQIVDDSNAIDFVWEVTEPFTIRNIPIMFSGNTSTISIRTDSLREFIAFSENTVMKPVLKGNIPNQDLHSVGIDENGNIEDVDMVIVSHPLFLTQAERLAAFHEERDSMKVVVVTTEQIYNEFSSGAQDVCAIRDFMKMLYDRADSSAIPSYLLLFGDGSYDPKYRIEGNTNYVITFQNNGSFDPIKSYMSDDFFALWDDNEGEYDYGDKGDLDAGVGRFPVKNETEAQIAVDKVIHYYDASTMGDWRNMLCFVADDEDDNIHLKQANNLANYVKTYYNQFTIDKIYLDAYKQTSDASGYHFHDVTNAINSRIDKGALIVNYTGHGGESGFAHERIIEEDEVMVWKNTDRMPIFMTASCEVSRFDNPELVSAGEHIFLNENGGGIALFSTVRVVYSSYNDILNQDFYKTVFERINGKYAHLGEIIMLTKNKSGINDNSKNFTLIGDPALKLAIPEYNVTTFKINSTFTSTVYDSTRSNYENSISGKTNSITFDTLKALTKVTISGSIQSSDGKKLSDFNGILYPTVYDKQYSVSTLANDDDSQVTNFYLQDRILFKGKTSIVNGVFSFSFIVPKDINLAYGYGKISYYVENGILDGNGYMDKVVVGGSNPNAESDTQGPDVELYLNDENFVFGDLTDANPLLLAFISDSNGVNTVGNGIGHDISAVLDANTEETVVLNEYYEADLDSYQSGSIQYTFNELSSGRHTLELSVWDVYNNSTKTYTEFIVAETADIALKHVLNYPNPFTTHTEFLFEHNQVGIPINVQIQIFTVSGKLIKTINSIMQTNDNHSEAIEWDGKDDYNNEIGKGVYIYRLSAQVATSKAEQIEKLVILR